VSGKTVVVPPGAEVVHVQRKGNVYQRLAVVQEAVSVKVTGANERGTKAISIKDTERALRDLLASHGVITRWHRINLESYEQKTSKGTMSMWRLHCRVSVINADDPEDKFEDEWEDVGTNPSAAASFTRKSYYKALLHIADADDDKVKEEPVSRVPAARTAPQRPPMPVEGESLPTSVTVDGQTWNLGGDCPVEGCEGRVGGSRLKPQCSKGHIPGGMAPEADGL